MPVMEAMASGLPIVIPYPQNDHSEGLESYVVFADKTPESFHKNIKKILNDKNLQKKLSEKSLEKAKDFDYKKIEKREAEIYKEVMSQKMKNTKS